MFELYVEYQDNEELDGRKEQEYFDEFYEDVYSELRGYGVIEEMCVYENMGEHLLGNVYVKYKSVESATEAVKNLNGRFYGGK